MKSINERISQNISRLRKNAKLTQLEFAEKINYSDKAVSKWENGDSIPSIEALEKICIFFGITLNDITSEHVSLEQQYNKRRKLSPNKLIIICLSILCVWLAATILFVYSNLIWQKSEWMVFIWAIPLSCVVGLVFNSIWGRKSNILALISGLIWSTLACLYLEFLEYNPWVIFILGVPLQISIILWSQLNRKKHTERVEREREERELLQKAKQIFKEEDSKHNKDNNDK